MELLTELNDEGTTIVTVTHLHDAGFASREIHLFDGNLVTDSLQKDFHLLSDKCSISFKCSLSKQLIYQGHLFVSSLQEHIYTFHEGFRVQETDDTGI